MKKREVDVAIRISPVNRQATANAGVSADS